MSETVVISPTSRQEGHAELSMEVDENGIVTIGLINFLLDENSLEI